MKYVHLLLTCTILLSIVTQFQQILVLTSSAALEISPIQESYDHSSLSKAPSKSALQQIVVGDDWWLPSGVERSGFSGFYWKMPSWVQDHNLETVEGIHYAKNIHVYWDQINPAEGVYDWSYIDNAISDIEDCDSCGFGLWPWYNNYEENIPSWVKEKYYLPYMSSGGIAAWHPASEFQDAIRPFLMALGSRYKDHPKLVYIDIRSPFDHNSGEFSLAGIYEEAKNSFQLTPDNFQRWSKTLFDDYATAFAGKENRLVMMISGPIHTDLKDTAEELLQYGYSKGFGERDGLPSNMRLWSALGHIVTNDGYVLYNSQMPHSTGSFWGSELTEFDINTDDFGPREHTPYRFWSALLYTMQMHRNWLAIPGRSDFYNLDYYGPMLRWAELELGKTVYTAPDAWTWLKENRYGTYYVDDPSGRTIKNVERWLLQRDVLPDGMSVPTARIDDEDMPYRNGIVKGSEYQARRTDHASSNDFLYFKTDDAFLSGGPHHVWVKITYLDDQAGGHWRMEYDSKDGIYSVTPWVENEGSGEWKTVTFEIEDIYFFKRQTSGMDFRIFNGGSQDITVKFVRIIKGEASPTSRFYDVPPDHWAYEYIEASYQAGYVAGCNTNPLMYCPENTMSRAESAVFVERGIHGADYLPGQPTELVFADVPPEEWFAKWSNALWGDGYTAGCGTDPLIYCPLQGHTRAEGSVFFLRMMYGEDYVPPTPLGLFADVPIDSWYADWAEAAYNAGIIPSCQTAPELLFCPEEALDRAMAAYMMVKAKSMDQ